VEDLVVVERRKDEISEHCSDLMDSDEDVVSFSFAFAA
jgi:hypothetical protein